MLAIFRRVIFISKKKNFLSQTMKRDENLSTINVRIYLTYQQLTASNKQGR